MTLPLSRRLVVGVTLLGLLVINAYLLPAATGRSQAADATVSISSAQAQTNSDGTVQLWLTPQPGVSVGALHVVITYDDTLLSAASCYNTITSSGCNTSFGPNQIGFAWVSYPVGISGLVGTITFNTLAGEGVASLNAAITTCADVQGFDLTCAAIDGEITIAQPTPSPTPSPSPTPPPPTPSPTASPAPRRWGDVNCDGVVTAVDALAILRRVGGLPVFQVAPCPAIGSPYP